MKLGLLLLNVLVVILLSGCGGGSSSSSEKPPLEEKTGIFVDDLVIGMKYITAQSSGYTNEKGEFPYNGGVVEFYIGNIKIGEITSLPSDGYLFIQDIIGVDRTNIEDERVLKIAKLLQSLDSNKDTDEIELLQGDLEKFNATKKDIQDIDVDTILMQQGFTPISKIDAKRHLNNMLKYYEVIESEDVLVLKDSSITNLETDVSLNPEISLFFSSDVRKNLINKNNILLKDSSDTLIDYEMKHEFDKVIIKPINSLHYSMEYKIIIKRVVEDYGRNSLENEGDNLDKIITFITETEPDTIAPEITLNGSENVFIYLGDEYLEVGAVATDNIDTNLEIKIVGSVDTNTIGKYFVTYSVSDSAGNITTKVRTVEVTPIPDTTAPTFTTADVVSVDENQTQSFIVNAIDDSIVTYKISGVDASYFNIDSTTGEITFKVAPDYETKNQYLISVTARDRSQNRSSQNITININDLDEISPVFTTLNSVSVDENQTSALTVNATDSSTVTYSISGTDASYFDIDSTTGEITFKIAPDYETKNQYLITVTATDTLLNFSTQNITININDIYEGITVTHNTISYITVKSPITGKIWLDRNLGATQACTKSREEFSSDAEYIADQKSCFGDYYQWGRLSDGHEKETSLVSSTQATDIKNAGADFISSSSSYSYDWARDSDQDKSLREIQWAKTDGSSVCPIGFRVPTSQELSDETIYYDGTTDESTGAVKIVNRDTAFKNFLKLPVAGIRINTNGTVSNQGELGSLWSNSNDSVPISQLYFEENSSFNYINSFASYGFSVRCIEDENLNPTANAGEDKVIFLGTNIEFDAINSSDSDSSISFYEWKEGSTVLSSSQNFSKSDFSLGEHTIILIITDDAGAKDFAKINIKVVPVSVTHNSLTYNLVISPITKRVWLDRNIGATSVCTKSRADFVDSDEYVLDQQSCFGGLYQWGRLTDGHEKRTSSSTSTKATSITNAGTDFIMDVDWLDGYIGGATRAEQWSKTDGTSICPIGFRVPTKTELGEDTITYDGIDDYVTGAVDIKDADTAFKNFLKIPFAGTRNEYYGSIERSGLSGALWSIVTPGTWSARAIYIDVSSSGVFSDLQFGRAVSVRCILD